MLWLAVHLPELSLEAFGATLADAPRAAPVALVADHHITAVNAAAARAGVQPGLKRATALALAPELLLGQADAARDGAALQAVAHVALAFTPAVTLDGHAVLLEVQSCLRYFGGAAALRSRLRQALAPLGHRVQIASAPTALGAVLLARWRADLDEGPHATDLPALQTLLDAAPVWLLGPGREHWEALQGMGLRGLADLRQLPRAGLARRFGEALLDDLDRARGTRADPRIWVVAPERFEGRIELAMRADSTAALLHGASLLLARLVAWARARQVRITAFTLCMLHEASRATTAGHTALRVELAEPSVDPAHLQLLLRERLATLQLDAPTLDLQLLCHEVVQLPAPNGELFPTRQGRQAGLARLLERLRARLGDEHVQQLQAVADHRPEHATRPVAMSASPADPDGGGGGAGRVAPRRAPAVPQGGSPAWAGPGPLARPVWLLPDPAPLAERQAWPWLDGQPLQLLAGPERIETGWWDGGLATRDYFIAQAGDGSLVWVYRARLPPASEAAANWFLQGRFG